MKFFKYQGTGNDFIIIDNRSVTFPKEKTLINQLCNRRMGIGADGLILLEDDVETDFKMVYYNADGKESSMCGNGGRCIVAFAKQLNLISDKTKFQAIDGLHEAEINNGIVKLKMRDVPEIKNANYYSVLDTGSPHYVQFIKDVEAHDVFTEGKKIRNSELFIDEGINVNFATTISDNQLFVRTYERGVEDETFSCGTGVTAAALTFMQYNHQREIEIKSLGGNLKVYATKNAGGFEDIWLEGPAELVFEGNIEIKE